MRSYILAVAVSMLLAAVYTFQNTSEITVHFLVFQRAFPQGVWEVILFSIGAVLMWFFSILASIETHTTYRKEMREREKRISELEEERSSLLNAFKHLPYANEPAAFGAEAIEPVEPKTLDRAVAVATVSEEPGGGVVAERPEGETDLSWETGEKRPEEEEKESGSI
ncbi:LapA family protein [Synergistaceae bacterium OttesenSCG-928-I11]|nr:LapA family protein [Synergistaceae bacterium OttesenSCG-928-I11]